MDTACLYQCPVCQNPLLRTGQRFVCSNQHSFDIARKGYVNLLLAHQMNSRAPGDNRLMVDARQTFLSAGFYQPLVDALIALAGDYGIKSLLDAGCGEGYYAAQLEQAGLAVSGVDISKEAVSQACRRSKSINWSIASVAALPYLSAQFDAVLSVFCMTSAAEFARVLNPGGLVFWVGPGDRHLPALRQTLYGEIKQTEADKQPADFADVFTRVETRQLTFDLALPQAMIPALLQMTPHYWHASQAQQEALLAQNFLQDQANFVIGVYRRD